MNNKTAIFFVLLALCALGILAVLASLVGGINIRAVGQTDRLPIVEGLPDALLPGTPATLSVLSERFVSDVEVALRTSGSTMLIPSALVRVTERGDVVLILPCDVSSGEATIVLSDAKTGQVIAYSRVIRILPPGPDCAF